MITKRHRNTGGKSAALLLLTLGLGLTAGCRSEGQGTDTGNDTRDNKTTSQEADTMSSKKVTSLPKHPELIEPGKAAPAFTLKDQADESHKLSDYRGQWVVLYFYPRDNTPGCTTEACGFRDSYDDLLALDAVVFGISPDDAKSHQGFTEKFDLPFPLLIDPGQKTASRYGVWREKNLYGKKHMGIVRTTYLIDPAGKVAHRWDKVKVADHVSEVIDVLNEQR